PAPPALHRRLVGQLRQVREVGISGWVRKLQGRLRKPAPLTRFSRAVRPISGEHKEDCEITQNSEITPGGNRSPSLRYPFYRPNTYSRLRDIEAPMMGACYLTE